MRARAAWLEVFFQTTPKPDKQLAKRRSALERIGHRFHERAGHHLSDGHERADADRLAFRDLALEWRVRRPPAPAGDINLCAHCGVGGEMCNPHLAGDGGHIWLHRHCWPPFDVARADVARRAVLGLLREARATGLIDTDVEALESQP